MPGYTVRRPCIRKKSVEICRRNRRQRIIDDRNDGLERGYEPQKVQLIGLGDVVEDAKSAADHRILTRIEAEAEPGCKVFIIRVQQGTVHAGIHGSVIGVERILPGIHLVAGGKVEDSDLVMDVISLLGVLVAQSDGEVQPPRDLPFILYKCVVGAVTECRAIDRESAGG